MTISEQIDRLEPVIEKRVPVEEQEKQFANFCKTARYLGNDVYTWANKHSTDTRLLYLIGLAGIKGIVVKGVTDR